MDWRGIHKGMVERRAQALLGEPLRVHLSSVGARRSARVGDWTHCPSSLWLFLLAGHRVADLKCGSRPVNDLSYGFKVGEAQTKNKTSPRESPTNTNVRRAAEATSRLVQATVRVTEAVPPLSSATRSCTSYDPRLS